MQAEREPAQGMAASGLHVRAHLPALRVLRVSLLLPTGGATGEPRHEAAREAESVWKSGDCMKVFKFQGTEAGVVATSSAGTEADE